MIVHSAGNAFSKGTFSDGIEHGSMQWRGSVTKQLI